MLLYLQEFHNLQEGYFNFNVPFSSKSVMDDSFEQELFAKAWLHGNEV
jgi:hypothetical protein